MNSDTLGTAGDIAFRAGAIIPCPSCGIFTICVDDANARRAAEAMATRAWRGRCRGFRGIARAEALEAVQAVIQEANWECPGCHPLGGD